MRRHAFETSITILIENSAPSHRNLASEHGLSVLVRRAGSAVLFDTGLSGAFIKNAALLGESLEDVTDVVLSHAHYDHTGGLLPFLESGIGRVARIWTGPHFFERKYSRGPHSLEYLGPDFDRNDLRIRGTMVNETTEREIAPGIYAVGGFTPVLEAETPEPSFLRLVGRAFEIDTFPDEVALVVEVYNGIALVVGCSHPGIAAIVARVRSLFAQPIVQIIGGAHLAPASRGRQDASIRYLVEKTDATLSLCHCTGDDVVARIAADYPDRLAACRGGKFFCTDARNVDFTLPRRPIER